MLFDPKWEQKVAIEPWRQALLDAADYIETHGWSRGLPRQGSAVCALEAIRRSVGRGRARVEAMDHLGRLFAPSFLEPSRWDVAMWNDLAGQTKANVVATMRAVARQGE